MATRDLSSLIKSTPIAVKHGTAEEMSSSGYRRKTTPTQSKLGDWLPQILQHPQRMRITREMAGITKAECANLCDRAAAGDPVSVKKLEAFKEFVYCMFTELRIITEIVNNPKPGPDGKLVDNFEEITRPYWVPPAYRSKIEHGTTSAVDGKSSDLIDRVMNNFKSWLENAMWLDFREVKVERNATQATREELIEQIKLSQSYIDALEWCKKTNDRIYANSQREQVEMSFEREKAAQAGAPMPDPIAESKDPLERAGLKPVTSWSRIVQMSITLTVQYCKAYGISSHGTLNTLHKRLAEHLGIGVKSPRSNYTKKSDKPASGPVPEPVEANEPVEQEVA